MSAHSRRGRLTGPSSRSGRPQRCAVTLTGYLETTYPENGWTPVFSPDGTKLVYTNVANQTLHVMDVKTNEITELLDLNWTIVGLSWSR
jgi:Tol biopolymer transport system component